MGSSEKKETLKEAVRTTLLFTIIREQGNNNFRSLPKQTNCLISMDKEEEMIGGGWWMVG